MLLLSYSIKGGKPCLPADVFVGLKKGGSPSCCEDVVVLRLSCFITQHILLSTREVIVLGRHSGVHTWKGTPWLACECPHSSGARWQDSGRGRDLLAGERREVPEWDHLARKEHPRGPCGPEALGCGCTGPVRENATPGWPVQGRRDPGKRKQRARPSWASSSKAWAGWAELHCGPLIHPCGWPEADVTPPHHLPMQVPALIPEVGVNQSGLPQCLCPASPALGFKNTQHSTQPPGSQWGSIRAVSCCPG